MTGGGGKRCTGAKISESWGRELEGGGEQCVKIKEMVWFGGWGVAVQF